MQIKTNSIAVTLHEEWGQIIVEPGLPDQHSRVVQPPESVLEQQPAEPVFAGAKFLERMLRGGLASPVKTTPAAESLDSASADHALARLARRVRPVGAGAVAPRPAGPNPVARRRHRRRDAL